MTAAPDPLTSDFASLVRQVRDDDAVLARIRERHLRESAAADATLRGVLLDWAERSEPVAVRTSVGRIVRGAIAVVARDAIVVGRTCVPLRAVAVVRPLEPGRRSPDASGDRAPARQTTFAAIVGDLAAARARVALVVSGEPAVLTGVLRSAGVDVVTVRPDGGLATTAMVAIDQLSEVTVLASG